jgi:MFS family permease
MTSKKQDSFNVFHNGELLTVLLIIFVDIMGFTIMIPLLPFFAESLGATPFQIGMLSSVYGLCSLIAGPFLGDLSDRYGRRKILLLSQLGSCLGFIILAFSNTLWPIFLSRIIDGITAGNMTVAQAYISDVTPPQHRTRAMSLIGASFGLGFILGPALSGLLSHFGHAAPIWASAFLSFLSVVGTYVFLKDAKSKSVMLINTRGPIAYMKKLIQLFHNQELKNCFILFFIFSSSFSLYFTGLAMFCGRTLKWNGAFFTVKEVSILLAYIGLIALFIQTIGMNHLIRKFGEVKIMIIGFTSTFLAFLIIGSFSFSHSFLPIFLMGITINTFGNAILRPAISGMLSQIASPIQQGLVFGLNQTLMSIAQIVCPLISGFLIQKNLNFFWCLLISMISLLGLGFGVFSSKNQLLKQGTL